MLRIYAIMAGAVLVAAVGGVWLATMYLRPEAGGQCGASQVAGGAAQIGGPFELVNGAGETVTEADVLAKPSLVYFGYTFCPDVCPVDTARNAEAVDVLTARGYDVTPVFITVDPKRDTPEVVGDFAANLHENMIGLTGSEDQIKAASKAYKTYYRVHDDEDDEYYLVDHSTFTYLMLPGTGFADFYRRDQTPEQIADSVACFIDSTPGAKGI
ncbi:MAG: SCO family protein [Pseudomonadota bacterium]|nr:SCO family protein [Pseudomonadota bacterium]